MKIESIKIQNFKRFSDLEIKEIPQSSKLVLLIGTNGCGKSCVFDAFEFLKSGKSGGYYQKYYKKNIQLPEISIKSDKADPESDGAMYVEAIRENFIGRSSIRIIPEINQFPKHKNLTEIVEKDLDGPDVYIKNDERFLNDVYILDEMIDTALRAPILKGELADNTAIFNEIIDPINQSLLRIFRNHEKLNIQIVGVGGRRDEPVRLSFKKGEQTQLDYSLLSHGEKQVVTLLLNFIVRKDQYKDKIIYIDEMDCHLNTALQYNLLKEIVENWIPDNSQLWTASHSLGFIDYAKDRADIASIIDFDSLDFDLSQVLTPAKNEFETYEVAVPKNTLPKLFKGKKIIFCEGDDDEFYNGLELENVVFVGGANSSALYSLIKNNTEFFALRDRDFLADSEIAAIKNKHQNYYFLKYYAFENYLYHPENIEELQVSGFDKAKYVEEILGCKKSKYDIILTGIDSSRMSYLELREGFKKDKESIIEDLKSDEFEKFYKFFDMKNFDKNYLEKFNLKKRDLIQTKWFKEQIKNIIEN